MKEEISIREWQKEFEAGTFSTRDRHTQIMAGWYDWFCEDYSLRNKTYKMGNIVKQVKDGGKVDLDNWYVWFKNNCPCSHPLYDDFRFAVKGSGDVMFTIQIDCGYNKHKYCVYGRKNDFETPLFECDNSRDLVKWLNTAWED